MKKIILIVLILMVVGVLNLTPQIQRYEPRQYDYTGFDFYSNYTGPVYYWIDSWYNYYVIVNNDIYLMPEYIWQKYDYMNWVKLSIVPINLNYSYTKWYAFYKFWMYRIRHYNNYRYRKNTKRYNKYRSGNIFKKKYLKKRIRKNYKRYNNKRNYIRKSQNRRIYRKSNVNRKIKRKSK